MTMKWTVRKSVVCYPKWLAAQAKTTRFERAQLGVQPKARYFNTWHEAFDWAFNNGEDESHGIIRLETKHEE